MAVKTARKKNPAAVALGRKGGKKGGPARAARLTPEQRSEIARKAVRARWRKAKEGSVHTKGANTAINKFGESRNQIDEPAPAAADSNTSDHALLTLLKRLKETGDPTKIRRISNQLERLIFHKQFKNT